MAKTTDTFVVEMLLKSDSVVQGVRRVQANLDGLKSSLQAVGLLAATLFVKAKINQFVDTAASIGQLSRSINENAEDIQAWGEAVKRQGGSVDSFNGSIKSLSDELNLIPVQGANSPLVAYLTRLNINFRNLDGSIKKPLSLLKELSVRFQGMRSAQSMAIGKKLGLDEATIRLLQQGRKGLDEVLKRMKEQGVLSQQDIIAGEKAKKMFQDLNQITTIWGLRLAAFFLPVAEKITKWLGNLAKWAQQHSRKVEAAVTGIGLAIMAALVPSIKAATVAAAGFLAKPIVAVALAAAAAFALLYEDYKAWAEGAESLLPWERIIDGLEGVVIWASLFKGTMHSALIVSAYKGVSALKSLTAGANGFALALKGALGYLTLLYEAWHWGNEIGEKFTDLVNEKFNGYEGKGAYDQLLKGNIAKAASLTEPVPQSMLPGRNTSNINNSKSSVVNVARLDIYSPSVDGDSIGDITARGVTSNKLASMTFQSDPGIC